MLFKYTVALPPQSLFCVLSHRIAPNITLNGSNSTGLQGASNLTFKICLVTLSINNNGNNTIAVGRSVNALMKLIHHIEGDANKVKIAPWKSKQPNLGVLKYTKGGKYPEAEVEKYVYAFR